MDTALVHVDTAECCPQCGQFLERLELVEPTLFRHGGYGAPRLTVIRLCTAPGCRWEITAQVAEVHPRTLALPPTVLIPSGV